MSKSCAPFKNEEIWDNNDATYSHATHYTYDIHGNVNTLLQDNPNTGVAGQEFKRLDYVYDLISGNVNEVVYQEGQLDMMIHQYEYDSDNRITSVETSTDGVFFDNDAKYFYYAHGPLARTELGENQVQGLDYVYTLQGWIKGVNSNTLDTTRDIGQDGNRVVGNPNAYFAKDVFGYTLNYFAGDYTAINSTVSQTPNNFEADKTNSDLLTSRKDFFNGNISAMVTTITNPTTGEVLPQGMAYDYDQLNRLLSAKAFVNLDMQTNTWQSGSTYANRYYNAFTYDANGNILTQTRYAENGTQIEDLTYQYNRNTNGKMLQNRLYHVNDNVAATAFTDDIDDQGTFSNTNHNNTNNYSYDGEGRLVRDDAEEIASITWTVTGKVKEVIRTSGSTKKNLKFRYDAMGQRIAKEVYDANNNWEKTTFYVRDPMGNVMGIYEKKNDAQTQQVSYKIAERNIYGSSMVGLVKSDVELISASAPSGTNLTHGVGEKQYYEQNSIFNVISVVSDLIIAQDWNGDMVVDCYRAEIISICDVFPFGSPMQTRTMNSTAVRHSFNGQEKDDEIYGDGYMTTAEFWQYDTRLARRWESDPVIKSFESPYSIVSGNPIRMYDPLGADGIGDQNGNITATVYVQFDSDANLTPEEQQAYIATVATNITSTWGSYTLPSGQQVNTANVRVLAAPAGLTAAGLNANENLITVGNGANADPNSQAEDVSYVTGAKSNVGYFYLSRNGSEAAHEFGHMLGLSDRYAEGSYYTPDSKGNGVDHGLDGRFTVPLMLTARQDPTNYDPYNNLMSNTGSGLSNMQLNTIFDGTFNKEPSYPAPCLIQPNGGQRGYQAIAVQKSIMGLRVTPYVGRNPLRIWSGQTIQWAYARAIGGFQTYGGNANEVVNGCEYPQIVKENKRIIRTGTRR